VCKTSMFNFQKDKVLRKVVMCSMFVGEVTLQIQAVLPTFLFVFRFGM
jgi:hypothetical protein